MNKLVENYFLKECIGKGVYGEVFRAVHQKTKEEFAVKVIPKSSFKTNPKLEQLTISEINVLSSLKNENIVRFIETLKTSNNFYFVYEYCNGGTLETLLKKRVKLKESQALLIFRQLLDAFKALNKNNIIHRDLKPDNIFLSDGIIKLGDFGFCKMLEINMAQTMLGSPIYMAPQILKEEIYTLKADIWSLGVVLFEMLFGYCPFQSSSISQLINMIEQTNLQIPKDVNAVSEETEVLIRKMLIKDQFKRIEWIDLFDIKISDQGQIVSGYKKELDIDTLQKYFLMELKNSQLQQAKGGKLLDGEASVLMQDEDCREIFSLKKTVSTAEQVQQGTTNKILHQFESKKVVSVQQPIHVSGKTQPVEGDKNGKGSKEPSVKSQDSFSCKHTRWIHGIEIMQELSMSAEEKDQFILHYVLVSLLRQVGKEYQKHPEWTDVLFEEKKCIQDALRALNKDENIDLEKGKAEIFKVWKSCDEKNRQCWSKAIQFVYESNANIETLLAC